jgi:ppGpp synthetase/RelA/SpoT-type nucleotidyltranferase
MAKLYIGYKAAASEALKEAPSHGTTVHQPDAALTANVAQFTKDNASNIVKIAKDKYKLKNPESLIKDFQKVVKKWEKIYSKVDRTSEEAIYKTLNSKLFNKINLNTHGL